MTRPILYCGDPHGRFHHIVVAASHTKASAVVLLGDMEPERPLHLELAPLIERRIPVFFIHGNHDADSDELWMRVWGSELASCNVHGRVVELPNGQRLAGLGGVFRETVWHPSASAARAGAPAFKTMQEHAQATPRQDRWQEGPPRKHWGTIYPETVDALADLRADVLITHEAPGYHPNGFALIDTLAQAMDAGVVIHGHHHDRIDSSARWQAQGFKSHGVGLRGISAIDAEGRAEVVLTGELDGQRAHRQRFIDDVDGWCD
ncbi:MAG TPA: metallophosphoesterase [Methylibium sp.]|uniref:metallophosphoesterase family protein n=1 Tax=Methylibium sp. TaxID=2067992 RepID=UPI002DBD2D3F|nr:metallophosphoesterase [Methylibium sp.]HEU4460875.1 metallophosphoesterase [Methylibium sp.]